MRNPTLRLFPAMLAIAIATCTPQTSHALFGREKSRLLEKAEETYTEALAAGEEGRILDEMTHLNEARAQYTQLYSRYPDYHTEHIQQMVAKCSLRIATLNTKIRSGEIAIPSPEAIAEGAGKGFVATDATAESAPESSPQRLVPALAGADDAMRVRLVQAIVEKDGPSQAMVLLEDLLEAEGEKTSETTRALFVKVLVACRNFKRASIEIDALRERHPDSPATLSLAAAVAAQKGDLTEAVYQLDKLIERFPAYSDAYVNLAYAYFMLDPVKNREMAAVYYRSAISYGAKRDPKLEEILDLDIAL
jgi:tetratricopeptide (TPR) repeat protein